MASTRSITTSHAAVACDVCGRTLLRGENADVFIAGGSRRMVCELCTARASHEGWIREGLDTPAPRRSPDRRGPSLLGRLRQRRRDEHPDRDRDRSRGGDLPPGGAEELLDAAAARAEPVYEAPKERHVHAVPTSNDLKMERALELFNASAHPRRIAGVARSLGEPSVSVHPSQTEGSVVGLAVAWELSWYRYEVDIADEAAGVRVIDQGTELSELPDEYREPNAVADERGLLSLAG